MLRSHLSSIQAIGGDEHIIIVRVSFCMFRPCSVWALFCLPETQGTWSGCWYLGGLLCQGQDLARFRHSGMHELTEIQGAFCTLWEHHSLQPYPVSLLSPMSIICIMYILSCGMHNTMQRRSAVSHLQSAMKFPCPAKVGVCPMISVPQRPLHMITNLITYLKVRDNMKL